MSSRMLTGSLLIIGPIVLILGFILIGANVSNLDWGDAQGTIGQLGENSGAVKTFLWIATLGTIMAAAGLVGLNQSMSGGSGAHYAMVGVVFYVIGTAVVLGEMALLIGTTEAASAGHQSVAEALYNASQAIGAAGVAVFMLGLAVIGVGIFVQKNLHQILSVLIVIVGIIGTVGPLIDYSSDLMVVPYLGSVIVTVGAGVLFLKSEN